MNNEQQKIELQHHSTFARLPKQKIILYFSHQI